MQISNISDLAYIYINIFVSIKVYPLLLVLLFFLLLVSSLPSLNPEESTWELETSRIVSKTALNFLIVLFFSNNKVFDFFNIVSYFLSSSSFIVFSFNNNFLCEPLNVWTLLIVVLLFSVFVSMVLSTSVCDLIPALILFFSFLFEFSLFQEEGTVTSDILFVASLNLKYY